MLLVLTLILRFILLFGLRVTVREFLLSDAVSIEAFNCSAQYPKFDRKKKLMVANALFRFIAFVLFVSFYVLQTAVCCLLYGVLPGVSVKYTLFEMILIDIVCLACQFVTFRTKSVKAIYQALRSKQWKRAACLLATETFHLQDWLNLVKCRRTWVDLFLLYAFAYAPYDKLGVVHCAFIQASYQGLRNASAFVAALGTLGLNADVASGLLNGVKQIEHAAKLANRILQGLLLTKLTLSQPFSFTLSYLFYLVMSPVTLEFIHV